MKYVIMVLMLNGSQKEWGQFRTELEANVHKTRLFEWNRKNGDTLKRRGFDMPHNWAEYDKKVVVTAKQVEQ